MVLAQSPAGPIEPVKDLKSRVTCKYWRPLVQKDGSIIWQETLPLPSDPINQANYLAKGFRLSPPGESDERTVSDLSLAKDALLEENARLKEELKMAKLADKRA